LSETLIRLVVKAKGRKVVESSKSYELREPAVPYRADLTPESSLLRLENTSFWDDII